jgi:hypothetical protein
MDAPEQHDGVAHVDPSQVDARELHHHIRAAGGDESGAEAVGCLDVLHLREPVGPEQLLGQVLRHDADRGIEDEPEARRLGRRRRRHHRPGKQAEQPRRASPGQPTQETSPRPAFSLWEIHRDLLSLAVPVLKGM